MSLYGNLLKKTDPVASEEDNGNPESKKAKVEKASASQREWVALATHAGRRGERDEMQDTYVLKDEFSIGSTPGSLYACFDGHAGKRASEHCSSNLEDLLSMYIPSQADDKGIRKAMKQTFSALDKQFLKQAATAQPHWKDGCTAAVVLVHGKTLYSANIGDTHVVLCRMHKDADAADKQPRALSLSKEHDPTSYEERQRIQAAGGKVEEGRVQGILQVSRSIGDGRFKGVGVINTPYVVKATLSEDTPFCIIACDGLWEQFSAQDAVALIHAHVGKQLAATGDVTEIEQLLSQASVALVNEAVKRGSQDNVTVLLVHFHQPSAFN